MTELIRSPQLLAQLEGLMKKHQNGEAELSTEKPPNQIYFKIDSKDRQSGQPVNNFRISKSGGMQAIGIAKMALESVNFHWTIENVNSYNNICQLEASDSTTYEVQIPIGFYNAETFCAAFQAAVLAEGFAGFTCSVNPTTGQLIMTNNSQDWRPVTDASIPGDQDLWQVMGMERGQFTNLPGSGFSSSFSVFWTGSYTRYVDIHSSTINQYETLISEGTHQPADNLVYRLYAHEDDTVIGDQKWKGTGGPWCRPHIINEKISFPKWISWSPSRDLAENHEIRLYDDRGRLLNINTNEFLGSDPKFSMSFIAQSLH